MVVKILRREEREWELSGSGSRPQGNLLTEEEAGGKKIKKEEKETKGEGARSLGEDERP